MAFSKSLFDKARQKANERLTGWITEVKQDEESGITRLQKEFKHVFKKIEWKPAPLEPKQPEGHVVIQDESSESLSSEGQLVGNIDGCATMPPGIPTAITLDDHEIHDSNSSNLSSRIGYREDIKLSEMVTPQRTPYSQADREDNERIKTRSPSPNYEWRGQMRNRRQGVTAPINFLPRMRRRKKRPKQALHRNTQSEEDDDADTFEQTNTLTLPNLLVKKSSTMLKTVPSTKNFGFKPLSRGGPLDFVYRRRPTKATKHAVSKCELFVPSIRPEQTTEERRKELLDRFRRVVRQLIHVRVLLNVSRLRIEEEEKTKTFKRFDGAYELSFDPSAFKTAISVGGLTVRARKALRKNPSDRNEEDAKILMEVMQRLPVFVKYPKSIKEDLARKMWYDNFQNGRVILRQGDPGSRMYFIISGEVDVKRTDKAPTGEQITYHIRTIKEGSSFGELALIRDIRREFTVICKGTSEFLSLSKDEFNQVLRYRWEMECNMRFNFLRTCDHFSEWTAKQLQMCADSSEMKEYPDNTVIIGDMEGQTDNVYFILKGRCEVVRRILLVRHQSPYLRPNLLLPLHASRRLHFTDKSYCRDRRINRPETRFLTVTTLHPGNYFGAGESLRDTFILSRGKTECVVINSAQFSIQGKSEQLRTLKRDRENAMPPNNELYRKFQENRKWYEYRNQLLQEVMNRKPVLSNVTLKHVPLSIVKEPTIPPDLIFYNRPKRDGSY